MKTLNRRNLKRYKTLRAIVVSAFVLFGTTCGFSRAQDSISINFGTTGRAELQAGANYGALGVDGGKWTIVSGPAATTGGTVNNLIDSTGTATSASLVWSAANLYYTPATGYDPTSQTALYAGYIDDGGNHAQINVSDIPFEVYNIYLYASTDTQNRYFASPTVNDLNYSALQGKTIQGSSQWGTLNSTYNATNVIPVEGGNYLLVTNQTQSALKIVGGSNVNSGGVATRGSLAAVQIVDATNGTPFTRYSITGNATFNHETWVDSTYDAPQGLSVHAASGDNASLSFSKTIAVDSLVAAYDGGNRDNKFINLSGGNIKFVGPNSAIYSQGVQAGNQFFIYSGLEGNITLYANGDTSGAPIRENNGKTILDPAAFSGSMRLADGLIDYQSKLIQRTDAKYSDGSYKVDAIILDGGGICRNSADNRGDYGETDVNILVGSNGGVMRTYAYKSETTKNYDAKLWVFSGAIADEDANNPGVLRKTEGGMIRYTGDTFNFTGTFRAETGITEFCGDSLVGASATIEATAGTVRFYNSGVVGQEDNQFANLNGSHVTIIPSANIDLTNTDWTGFDGTFRPAGAYTYDGFDFTGFAGTISSQYGVTTIANSVNMDKGAGEFLVRANQITFAGSQNLSNSGGMYTRLSGTGNAWISYGTINGTDTYTNDGGVLTPQIAMHTTDSGRDIWLNFTNDITLNGSEIQGTGLLRMAGANVRLNGLGRISNLEIRKGAITTGENQFVNVDTKTDIWSGASFNVENAIVSSLAMNVTGGTLNVSNGGTLVANTFTATTSSTVNIQDGGIVNVTGASNSSSYSLSVNSSELAISGGVLSATGANLMVLAGGTVNISGGITNLNGIGVNTGTATAPSAVNITGGFVNLNAWGLYANGEYSNINLGDSSGNSIPVIGALSGNVNIDGNGFNLVGETVFAAYGRSIKLNGTSLPGAGGIDVIGGGSVFLASKKTYMGATKIISGMLHVGTGYLPDATGTAENPLVMGGIGERPVLKTSGDTTVGNIALGSGSTFLEATAGVLTVSNLTRLTGAELTNGPATVVLANHGGTVSVTAGAGFSTVGTSGSEILPGVFIRTSTSGSSGKMVTLDANNLMTAVTPNFTINNTAWDVESAVGKNVLANERNKAQPVTANITFNSLTTQGDFLINSGATITLASGNMILQGGNHWVQSSSGVGHLTSSYSSDAGKTYDLYVYTADAAKRTDGDYTYDISIKNGVNITDNGSTPVNLIKEGPWAVASALKLGTTNTYTGYTQVNSGTMYIMCGMATSDFRVMGPGAELNISTGASITNQQYTVSAGSTLNLNVGGDPYIKASNEVGGTINLSGATNNAVFDQDAIFIAVNASGTTNFVRKNGYKTESQGGAITAQTFTSSGTTTLGSADGGFQINALNANITGGTTTLTNGSSLYGIAATLSGAGALTVNNGTLYAPTLTLNGTSTLNVSGPGAVALTSTATLNTGTAVNIENGGYVEASNFISANTVNVKEGGALKTAKLWVEDGSKMTQTGESSVSASKLTVQRTSSLTVGAIGQTKSSRLYASEFQINQGTVNVLDGANVSTDWFQLGKAAEVTAQMNLSGGTVSVRGSATGDAFAAVALGVAGTQANLLQSGGTFSAPDAVVMVGIGAAETNWNITGGKAIVRGLDFSGGMGLSQLYVANTGILEIGYKGIIGASLLNGKQLIGGNGGTIRATAAWTSDSDLILIGNATAAGTTFDVGAYNVTLNGFVLDPIQYAGANLTVAGTGGKLILNGYTDYSGTTTIKDGAIVQLGASHSGNLNVTLEEGGKLLNALGGANLTFTDGTTNLSGTRTGDLIVQDTARFSPGEKTGAIGTVSLEDGNFSVVNNGTLVIDINPLLGDSEQIVDLVEILSTGLTATLDGAQLSINQQGGALEDKYMNAKFSFLTTADDDAIDLGSVSVLGALNADWADARWALSLTDLETGGQALQLWATDGAHVPEPATWALLVLGAAGLFVMRRKNG